MGGAEAPGMGGAEAPGHEGTEGSADHETVPGDAWSVPGEHGPESWLDHDVKGGPEDRAGTDDRQDPERK